MMNIIVVEAGTEVGKDHEGNPMIVTEETAVFQGARRCWMTQRLWDRVKEAMK